MKEYFFSEDFILIQKMKDYICNSEQFASIKKYLNEKNGARSLKISDFYPRSRRSCPDSTNLGQIL